MWMWKWMWLWVYAYFYVSSYVVADSIQFDFESNSLIAVNETLQCAFRFYWKCDLPSYSGQFTVAAYSFWVCFFRLLFYLSLCRQNHWTIFFIVEIILSCHTNWIVSVYHFILTDKCFKWFLAGCKNFQVQIFKLFVYINYVGGEQK